jgi:hypothetical protein
MLKYYYMSFAPQMVKGLSTLRNVLRVRNVLKFSLAHDARRVSYCVCKPNARTPFPAKESD